MVATFEIINHGWEHAQYFQGCGVSFTKFEHVATGAGNDAVEAFNDALEQVYSFADAKIIPHKPRGSGINRRNKVPADHCGEDSEFYYYVSIRYTVEEVTP